MVWTIETLLFLELGNGHTTHPSNARNGALGHALEAEIFDLLFFQMTLEVLQLEGAGETTSFIPQFLRAGPTGCGAAR